MQLRQKLKPIVRHLMSYWFFLTSFGGVLDKFYAAKDVPLSRDLRQWDLLTYVETPPGAKVRILEVGSREVTGFSEAREKFLDADYVGFDYYPGRNVDVVGDVHCLSSYFDEDDKFDFIYTSACFEHFAMPWIAALEITKMLKVGGILSVKTHFSYSSHERPWNFFQFSDLGLQVLFSEALGYECIESGMQNPMIGRFSSLSPKSLRYRPIRGLYCSSEFLGRKVKDVQGFDWAKVTTDEVVKATTYPAPDKLSLKPTNKVVSE